MSQRRTFLHSFSLLTRTWSIWIWALFTASSTTAVDSFYSEVHSFHSNKPQQGRSCHRDHWQQSNQNLLCSPSILWVWYLKSNSSCCSSRHIIVCSMHCVAKRVKRVNDCVNFKQNTSSTPDQLHLHVTPETRHFSFKVLLAVCLHDLWLNAQVLDLRHMTNTGVGVSTDITASVSQETEWNMLRYQSKHLNCPVESLSVPFPTHWDFWKYRTGNPLLNNAREVDGTEMLKTYKKKKW